MGRTVSCLGEILLPFGLASLFMPAVKSASLKITFVIPVEFIGCQ